MNNSQAAGVSNVLLEARNVSHRYKLDHSSVEVLRGVSLEVVRGSFIALRGASGAGKSTLLHLLGGLDQPSEGEIWVDGINLGVMSAKNLAAFRSQKVGFVFQAYHLLPELDALENVCLPARIRRADVTKTEERGRALLKRVGLERRLRHRPSELSGGEQQRVAIARSLVNSPEILFADEPTGNLDSHNGQEIIRLLVELQAENGMTLLVATHDHKVAQHAPVVIDLVDGQIAVPAP